MKQHHDKHVGWQVLVRGFNVLSTVAADEGYDWGIAGVSKCQCVVGRIVPDTAVSGNTLTGVGHTYSLCTDQGFRDGSEAEIHLIF